MPTIRKYLIKNNDIIINPIYVSFGQFNITTIIPTLEFINLFIWIIVIILL